MREQNLSNISTETEGLLFLRDKINKFLLFKDTKDKDTKKILFERDITIDQKKRMYNIANIDYKKYKNSVDAIVLHVDNIDYGVNILYVTNVNPPELLYVLHNNHYTGITSPTGQEYGGYNHGDRFKIKYNNIDKTMKLINMTQNQSVKNTKTLTDDFINRPRSLIFASFHPAYCSGIKFVDVDKI